MKRKILEPLIPVLIGPGSDECGFNFSSFTIELLSESLGLDPFYFEEVVKPKKATLPPKMFPGDLLTELKEFFVGKEVGLSKLVDEFKLSHPTLSKAVIETQIRAVGIREKRAEFPKTRWYIKTGDVIIPCGSNR